MFMLANFCLIKDYELTERVIDTKFVFHPTTFLRNIFHSEKYIYMWIITIRHEVIGYLCKVSHCCVSLDKLEDGNSLYHNSPLRSSFLSDVTQRRLVVSDVSGLPIGAIFMTHAVLVLLDP
jgi:hypothetical protein